MPRAPTIQCLERALDILQEVSTREEVGITELADTLGLHPSTVANIVRTLTFRNVLLNRNRRYRIGPALSAMAQGWDPVKRLAEFAREAVTVTTAETGESSLALVLTGSGAQVLSFLPAPDELAVLFPREILRHPLGLSTGQLLAAYADDDIRSELLSQAPGSRRAADWERRFRRIRDEGCVVTDLREPRETDSLAVPVRDAGGQVVAALGASCPRTRSSPAHLSGMLSVVKRVAADTSAKLGFTRDMSDISSRLDDCEDNRECRRS